MALVLVCIMLSSFLIASCNGEYDSPDVYGDFRISDPAQEDEFMFSRRSLHNVLPAGKASKLSPEPTLPPESQVQPVPEVPRPQSEPSAPSLLSLPALRSLSALKSTPEVPRPPPKPSASALSSLTALPSMTMTALRSLWKIPTLGVQTPTIAPAPASSSAVPALPQVFTAPGCHPSRPNDTEREAIANVHNRFRRKVAKGEEQRGNNGPQPKAKNMRVMNYDLRLEDIAFKWASFCAPQLPKDRPIEGYATVYRSLIYQNGLTDLFNSTASIINRYEKVTEMNGLDAIGNFSGKNSLTGKDIRSYAIIVNAETYGIGCAHAYHHNEITGRKQRFYVCTYGSGIRKNGPLYKQGEPCEGLRHDCCDRGLVRAYCWADLDK